jgi:hypothetical protein
MAGNGKTIIAVIVVIVLIAAAIGVYTLQQPATGTMSIYVKDDAIAWKHVNITFTEVRVQQASANNDSGWQTVSIKNGSIDLASLTNVSELLASSAIPAGKYTQIRIVVGSATGMMLNGTHVTFVVPSGELKTTHPFNLTAGSTKKLTLEIDLQRSIVQNGSGWTFTPVLGAVSET